MHDGGGGAWVDMRHGRCLGGQEAWEGWSKSVNQPVPDYAHLGPASLLAHPLDPAWMMECRGICICVSSTGEGQGQSVASHGMPLQDG